MPRELLAKLLLKCTNDPRDILATKHGTFDSGFKLRTRDILETSSRMPLAILSPTVAAQCENGLRFDQSRPFRTFARTYICGIF